MSHSEFLAAALDAAHAAADVVRHYYQRNLKVTIKADKSPVTEADVETEKTIRSILGAKFPGHGFYGEETGTHALDAEYVWVVDPIDGTKAFVREYPMFSTQIALMRAGRLIVGVSSAPAYGELAYGEIGVGAWLNEQPIRVSAIDTIEAAALSTGNLKTLATGPRWLAFGQLVGRLEPHPRLRRFPALSPARVGSHRRGRRVRRQHPRRGRVRRDRRSRGRPVHRP